MKSRKLTRRDLCYLYAKRAARLSGPQAALAWQFFASEMDRLGGKDLPRFRDIIIAFRAATLAGVGGIRRKKTLPFTS